MIVFIALLAGRSSVLPSMLCPRSRVDRRH